VALAVAVALPGPTHPAASAAAASCDALRTLSLANTTITLAQEVPAGGFTMPSPSGAPQPAAGLLADLPAFCRVAATLAPSSDSEIKVEVWLPASNWNGKFQGVGNGGWSGAINYGALAAALRRGYAAASTDTGHSGGRGEFALGHPEKLIDFGWRAVHEMTGRAKQVIDAYYGAGPRLSYWTGCSSGGKQGLKEAQRFPADYDAIVAGAPANYWTHLVAMSISVAQATLRDAASFIPRQKYQVLHDAVMAACDAGDGVTDGVLEDPTRCRFDPAAIQCKGGDAADCLTGPQVAAARKIYAPVTNPRTGAEIFPGLEPGSEKGWAGLAGGPGPLQIADDHFKFVVFKDPAWDFRTLDFDRGVAEADRIDGGLLNANDPDLRPFFARGGKILMYHGWNDQLIPPRNSIEYLRQVEAVVNGREEAARSIRLFMVPGMAHCAGGDGPSTFDALGALEQWVEHDAPPQRIVASKRTDAVVVRTRPLCPYPQVARYSGRGSTDDEQSFVCAAP
jgi:feruloyl esterase